MEYACKHCGCVNHVNHKSNRQNDYFHGVLMPHAQKAWFDNGEVYTLHECKHKVKMMFLSYYRNGELYPISTSNKEWSRGLWENKMQQIRMWFEENLSYQIPEPNERIK